MPEYTSRGSSLSTRLLILTIFFIMVAEVAIYVPSISRFRVVWLTEKLDMAHLAALAVEATPDGMVDEDLQMRLLKHAGALAIVAQRPDNTNLVLTPAMPPEIHDTVDLAVTTPVILVRDAFEALTQTGNRVLKIRGPAPQDMDITVEALVPEGPLREAMWDYSFRILELSLLISVVTAALVFYSLHRLLVQPMRRLNQSITQFAEDPENPRKIIAPSARGDEVGAAERALAAMQHALHTALGRKSRLADVGTGVAKISHDLRGILSSAMLESDRLEMKVGTDPEVKTITAGLVDALDRAVGLCTKTLRFAKLGPPDPHVVAMPLAGLINKAARGHGALVITVDLPKHLIVLADPELTQRIVDNLLANSHEAGARTVAVALAESEEPGRVAVSLRDDGHGLPPKARDNLFQPFSGSAKRGGTGLGLPIAKELAEAQGGGLRLADTGEDGTEFVVTFRISLVN